MTRPSNETIQRCIDELPWHRWPDYARTVAERFIKSLPVDLSLALHSAEQRQERAILAALAHAYQSIVVDTEFFLSAVSCSSSLLRDHAENKRLRAVLVAADCSLNAWHCYCGPKADFEKCWHCELTDAVRSALGEGNK